jgi:hypothetical protein
VELGVYHVEGHVHGTPASDFPFLALRRAAWVPLTDATISCRRGSEDVRDEFETLLVNGMLAASFKTLEVDGVAVPWETARPGVPPSPRAVDLTGTLRDDAGGQRGEWCACSIWWFWRARQDSNPRPSGPKPLALSTELQARAPYGTRRGGRS